MLSCDTFALGKNNFSEMKNCLAKNSDRPLGEAQPIDFYPGGEHQDGEMLRCTYITVPQAKRTYTVLGCRPHWIWGFEMGVNEMGLAIGNEAEGSRCEPETVEGLLGMDLLRLALERAATAREGVGVIAGMLEEYGQNANANLHAVSRYENSFMLVDREEIWLMETAGRRWAAKKIENWAAISNCYTIGGDYDACSEGLEDFAREKRWLNPGEPFDFAKAYTMQNVRQGRSVHRWRRMQKLISGHEGPLDRRAIAAILRDHYEDELVCPRWGGGLGTFASICMHAQTLENSQTAASMIYAWDDLLGPVVWYAPSTPCCSVYIPVYWNGKIPDIMKNAEGMYSEDSLWWVAHRFGMLVSADEERFGPGARKALRALEEKVAGEAQNMQTNARALVNEGRREEALRLLSDFTEEKAGEALSLFRDLSEEISSVIREDGGLYGVRLELLTSHSNRVGMKL